MYKVTKCLDVVSGHQRKFAAMWIQNKHSLLMLKRVLDINSYQYWHISVTYPSQAKRILRNENMMSFWYLYAQGNFYQSTRTYSF